MSIKSGYKGDSGWNSEGWNKMVKEFHLRNKYVSYTKAQIQEKEGQLKRDYKMLKEARRQSGSHWNEKRNMVEGPQAMWDNLVVIKKFRNNKASFPLYDALGELYDGHLAEDEEEDAATTERGEDVLQRTTEGLEQRNDAEDLDDIREVTPVQRSGLRRTTTASRNIQGKEEKRPRRGARVEEMMARFLETREEEVARLAKKEEEEAAHLAREKEVAESNDFSIKRCISVLNAMEVTKEEKAKAFAVFIKSKENRETFISGCEADGNQL